MKTKCWSNLGLQFFRCTFVSYFGFLSGNRYNFTNGSVEPVDQSVGCSSAHSRIWKCIYNYVSTIFRYNRNILTRLISITEYLVSIIISAHFKVLIINKILYIALWKISWNLKIIRASVRNSDYPYLFRVRKRFRRHWSVRPGKMLFPKTSRLQI